MSTVSALLDALVATVRAALPKVQVLDGMPAVEVEGDVVVIGFTGEPGETAVESTRTREQLTTGPDRESYDVTCLASSWHGAETDPKTVRDRAYELATAVAEVTAADPTVGGAVMRARVSAGELAQEQTSGGAVATVRFTVHVDAYTRP